MANTAARVAGTPSSFLDLDEEDVVGTDEEGLDLEAYLDLEESPEIARLMQQVRDGAAIGPAQPDTVPRVPSPVQAAPRVESTPAPATRLPGAVAALDGRVRPASTPSAISATPASPARLRPEPESGRVREPWVALGEAGAPRQPAAGRPGRLRPLDTEGVARTLGEVQVQGRQLVVACPACGGRPTIVIYANRFKCFGCEATGDEAALAAHLTGWDARRVAQWLASATPVAAADGEAGSGRRPWRLPFFAR